VQWWHGTECMQSVRRFFIRDILYYLCECMCVCGREKGKLVARHMRTVPNAVALVRGSGCVGAIIRRRAEGERE